MVEMIMSEVYKYCVISLPCTRASLGGSAHDIAKHMYSLKLSKTGSLQVASLLAGFELITAGRET